jgi:hypothetical protein
LETVFLVQIAGSIIERTGDIVAALDNPFFALGMLSLDNEPPPESPGNVAMVAQFILNSAPDEAGKALAHFTKALLGLEGMVSLAFAGDREAYVNALV